VKHPKPWSNCVCGPSIVLYLKLAIYCDSTWYNVHTYTTEELFIDPKKNRFPGNFFLTNLSKDLGIV
jgi:hypothetical protein